MIFTDEHYQSQDGFLTSVWGPPMWHFLHTMSFNYPTHPTEEQKKQYRDFMISLQNVLPCKYCRINLTKNMKELPLTWDHMKDRHSFSLYVYELHELVNRMLGKKSNLTFENVRYRYEHFRARGCSKKNKTMRRKENGCVRPSHGEKTKCVLKIVSQKKKCPTFQVDRGVPGG